MRADLRTFEPAEEGKARQLEGLCARKEVGEVESRVVEPDDEIWVDFLHEIRPALQQRGLLSAGDHVRTKDAGARV